MHQTNVLHTHPIYFTHPSGKKPEDSVQIRPMTNLSICLSIYLQTVHQSVWLSIDMTGYPDPIMSYQETQRKNKYKNAIFSFCCLFLNFQPVHQQVHLVILVPSIWLQTFPVENKQNHNTSPNITDRFYLVTVYVAWSVISKRSQSRSLG